MPKALFQLIVFSLQSSAYTDFFLEMSFFCLEQRLIDSSKLEELFIISVSRKQSPFVGTEVLQDHNT